MATNNLAVSFGLVSCIEACHIKQSNARFSALTAAEAPPSEVLLASMLMATKSASLLERLQGDDDGGWAKTLGYGALGGGAYGSKSSSVKIAGPWGRIASKIQPAMQWMGGKAQQLGSRLPQGMKSYMNAHPMRAAGMAGLAGAGIAGGGVQGINSYADYRKREAIRNMGFGNRLGLAFQLMANPNGFANYV